jgi:hypothetical protein
MSGELKLVDRKQFGEISGRPDFRSDVYWVYQHYCLSGVKASDAPSPGAWALLEHLRRVPDVNIGLFYRDFCVRLLPSQKQLEQEERRGTDDELIERAGRLLEISASIRESSAG